LKSEIRLLLAGFSFEVFTFKHRAVIKYSFNKRERFAFKSIKLNARYEAKQMKMNKNNFLLTPWALDISFIYSRAHIFKASVNFTKFCDAVDYGHKNIIFHTTETTWQFS